VSAAEQGAADSHWKSLLNDHLDQRHHFVDVRTDLPDLLNLLPREVQDSAIAGVLMARRVNDCKDYDQWLESVQEAREKIARQRAAAGQGSGSPPIGSEGTEGTEDTHSLTLPTSQTPLPETMETVDPEETARLPGPPGPPDGGTTHPEEVNPEEAAAVQEQIAQSLAEAERAERDAGRPVAAPAFIVEVETLDHPGTVAAVYGGKKQIVRRYDRLPEVPPEGEMNVFDPERTLRVENPPSDPLGVSGSQGPQSAIRNPQSAILEGEPDSGDPDLPETEAGLAGDPEAPTVEEGSADPPPLDEVESKRLWQQVQEGLEEDGWGSPLLGQACLQWEGPAALLRAPVAVSWAIERRQERIQALLQHLTGRKIAIQVRGGP
jgi:hypothetical protein